MQVHHVLMHYACDIVNVSLTRKIVVFVTLWFTKSDRKISVKGRCQCHIQCPQEASVITDRNHDNLRRRAKY